MLTFAFVETKIANISITRLLLVRWQRVTRLLIVQADLCTVLFSVIVRGSLIVFLLLVGIVLLPVVRVVSVEQILSGAAAFGRRSFAGTASGLACFAYLGEIMNERGREELEMELEMARETAFKAAAST